MLTYPLTPSQYTAATAEQLIAGVQSPAVMARRLGEILSAQQFIGMFLLSGRYTVQGGAIAVPINETFRTDRSADTVNAGAEYKLTALSAPQLEIYLTQKEGIATEITDELINRALRQPIDDALLMLRTELVFDANELALGVAQSAVTQSIAAAATWTTGKAVLRDALRAKASVRKLKLGYSIDTAVLPADLYAEVMPELLDILPDSDRTALTGDFPTIGGITWVTDDGDDIAEPMFLDRERFGGIATESIPSPEYRKVGDTNVEIASIREPKADKTRLQARNVHVPVVTNPLAAVKVTGTF